MTTAERLSSIYDIIKLPYPVYFGGGGGGRTLNVNQTSVVNRQITRHISVVSGYQDTSLEHVSSLAVTQTSSSSYSATLSLDKVKYE